MALGSDNQYSPRRKVLFVIMAALHGAAIFIPLLLVALGLWEIQKEEKLSVNLVDEPSAGPVVDIKTTRLPPSKKPNEKVAPEPVPEQPDIPNLPPVPMPPKQPKFKIPDMPVPPPPKQPTVKLPHPRPAPKPVKAPKQPSVPRPKTAPRKPVKETAKTKPDDKRKFTPLTSKQIREMNSNKSGQRTGRNFNKDVPIGTRDTAQRYAPKFSNTPQGGPNSAKGYKNKLGIFIGIYWHKGMGYVPSLADLGNRIDLSADVKLEISGNGQLLKWQIVRSSGNRVFDAAIQRLFTEKRQFPAPDDGKSLQLTVTLGTED